MLDVALPFARSSHGVSRRATPRTDELMRLAREVEPAQPALAVDLRGLAMHEAAVGMPPAAASVARTPWWRRAAAAVWSACVAYGEGRARRDLLALAQRYESTQPEVARELRQACARNA